METIIRSGLAAMGIDAPAAPGLLAKYGELLVEKNQVMNLTAITEPDLVAQLHFLDSAALLGAADFKGQRVIDVGTGAGFPGLPLQGEVDGRLQHAKGEAGFPGLPLRVLEPSIDLTLLDSLDKRINWLREICTVLGAKNVTCVHARAEEQALVAGYHDGFDIAVSRAVGDLRLLSELCLPYVKVGGYFLAMKGVGSDEELSTAMSAIQLLGGKALSPYDYTIPGTDVRHRVVVIEKIAPTPKGYPRRWAKIQKSPL